MSSGRRTLLERIDTHFAYRSLQKGLRGKSLSVALSASPLKQDEEEMEQKGRGQQENEPTSEHHEINPSI